MPVADVLATLDRQISRAIDAIEADDGASPVLLAVVRELARKRAKAANLIADAGPALAREAVVELEQAADSAKAAAAADAGASDATRAAVIEAHDTICTYKGSAEAQYRPTG